MPEAAEKSNVIQFPKMSRRISQRSNWMLFFAWLSVIALSGAVLFLDLGEFAQGVLTLVLGRSLGWIDMGFNIEFGTTKNSQMKDDTIQQLSNTAATTASTAAAVAATTAGVTNVVNGVPVATEEVKITTDNVTVTSTPPTDERKGP